MAKKIIQETHDIIFNWLLDWSKRAKQDRLLNPYFYVRTKEDDRFKQGYWFPGNDNYTCISFWSGGDTKNRTPNIYFELHSTRGMSIKLIGRDSANKEKFFQLLADYLGGYKQISKGVFSKTIGSGKDTVGYMGELIDFVDNEKVKIDEFLKSKLADSNSPEYLLLQDEYSAPTGFLTQGQFDTLISNVLRQREKFAPTNVSVKLTVHSKEKLDDLIFLRSFKFDNYKGIIECEIPEIKHFANWIFITGENGFGKTCILQALALGLTNYPENPKYYKSQDNTIEKVVPGIEVRFHFKADDPEPTNFLSIAHQSNFRSANDYFLAYGVNRLEPQREQSENLVASNSSNIFTLFESGGVLKNFNFELKKHAYSAPDRFKTLKQLITDVTNGRIADVVVKKKDFQVQYVEKTNDGKLPAVDFEDLATGYRNIINIVGDIYIRFSESQRTIDPKRLVGIVCIDELENHLHVKFQKELPGLLSKIFPKIQFIATTHSPIPLLGAQKNSVILRVTRNAKKGVQTERIDESVDFTNLLPNAILTSPIFGLVDITSKERDPEKFVRVENTYAEVVFNDKVQDRIDGLFSKENAAELKKLLKKK